MANEIRCVELGRLAVPGLRIKVRWFPDGARRQNVWRATSNILSLSLISGEPVRHRSISRRLADFQPAGPLTFWPRSAEWESRANASQMLTVSSYFDGDFLPSTGRIVPEGIPIDDFSILEMMRILHDEVRTPGESSEDLVGAVGCALRIKLSRPVHRHPHWPAADDPSSRIDIAMIDSLLRTSGGNIPSASELARRCNTSRRSLLRYFQAATGKTPSRYIDDIRLERAKMLLAASNMTLKQIAYEAGYATASHFSSKFRQLTGMTPGAFRSSARLRS